MLAWQDQALAVTTITVATKWMWLMKVAMAVASCGDSPMVTYLCGEWDAQQEASHSHSQRYEGLFADDPLIAHLIHNGRDQSLQQAELRMWQRGQHVTILVPPCHPI